MSIISSDGYDRPDYSSTLPELDGPIEAWSGSFADLEGVTLGTLDCRAYTSSVVYVSSLTGAATLELQYGVTGDYSSDVTYTDYYVMGGFVFPFIFRSEARLSDVTISAYDLTNADNDISIYAWPSNRPTTSPPGSPANATTFEIEDLVAGWQYSALLWPAAGPAVIWANCTDNYDVALQVSSGNDKWSTIWEADGQLANVSVSEYVAIPPGFLRLGVNDTGSTGGTFTGALTLVRNTLGS